jgi:pimeloyl-ACP methyl ester carboxylesterase
MNPKQRSETEIRTGIILQFDGADGTQPRFDAIDYLLRGRVEFKSRRVGDSRDYPFKRNLKFYDFNSIEIYGASPDLAADEFNGERRDTPIQDRAELLRKALRPVWSALREATAGLDRSFHYGSTVLGSCSTPELRLDSKTLRPFLDLADSVSAGVVHYLSPSTDSDGCCNHCGLQVRFPETNGLKPYSDLVEKMFTPVRATPSVSAVPWGKRDSLDSRVGKLAFWTAGSGTPILLVHGWDSQHTDLDAFVEPLLARGYRVVALDLPAHGETTGPGATLTDAADAIVSLGAHVGPLGGVIAHSAGCPAIGMALERGLRADRVALIATPMHYERFVRWFASEEGLDFEELVAALRGRGIDVAALDLRLTAAKLDVPALIVHSADDRTTEIAGARAVAAAWRGAEFLEVNGLGHMRILRDPFVIERVVDFIAAP